MENNASDPAIQVTAEERNHPALQMVARALISLQRWRQARGKTAELERQPDMEASDAPEASDGSA